MPLTAKTDQREEQEDTKQPLAELQGMALRTVDIDSKAAGGDSGENQPNRYRKEGSNCKRPDSYDERGKQLSLLH